MSIDVLPQLVGFHKILQSEGAVGEKNLGVLLCDLRASVVRVFLSDLNHRDTGGHRVRTESDFFRQGLVPVLNDIVDDVSRALENLCQPNAAKIIAYQGDV